ncbi:peptide methionine sulfoxide reductase MsrA [Pelagophyceae sp. CCMP2097]|nr:peptide methionine sulfoxide reductase MsrA [Pelagophyceae sp. CCMP2097]
MLTRAVLLAALSAARALRAGRGCAAFPRAQTSLRAQKSATLGLGCFWAPSEALLNVAGVEDTACGYAGAAFPGAQPTYRSVCGGDGNVETVRVVYDDDVLTFEQVLDAAFNCAAPAPARQYAPIIFAEDEVQSAAAERWRANLRKRPDGLGQDDFQVELLVEFWRAEGYHQTYWQKWRPRYAVLAGLILAQWSNVMPTQFDNACTGLAVGIAGLTVWERIFDESVVKVEKGKCAVPSER